MLLPACLPATACQGYTSLTSMLLPACLPACYCLPGIHVLDQHADKLPGNWQGPPPPQEEAQEQGAGAGAEEIEADATAAPPPATAIASPSWEAWAVEGLSKGSLLYHADLIADCLVHTLTLAHYCHVWVLHGFAFQVCVCVCGGGGKCRTPHL